MKNLIVLSGTLMITMLMAGCGSSSSDSTTTPVTTKWYQDIDGDSFGDPATEFIGDQPDMSWVSNNTDCDDSGPNASDQFPGNSEVLDSLDNDCDGSVDEDFQVNNCTELTATDLTGQATVDIGEISAWGFNHSACIMVSEGTIVTWQGNFTTHPLGGGEAPTANAASPITIAGPGTGSSQVDVTFANTGDYPYYCLAHTTGMQGVLYVR